MTEYNFTARNKDGDIVTGEIDAANETAAKSELADNDLFPISLESKGVELELRKLLHLKKTVKTRDLLGFTRQFAALFEAGVPMRRLMPALSNQTSDPDFSKALMKIGDDINAGTSISAAFQKYPDYFNELYVNMINVGEQGGLLEQTLKELAKVLEKEYRIYSRIKSATLYPKIVLVVFFLVASGMVIWVVPKFAEFYGNFGAELPLPTRMLVGMSDIIKSLWYVVALVMFSGYILIKRYFASKSGRFKLDQLRLKIPVFGELNLKVANARFGHLIGALYKSGVSLVKALGIVGRAVGNKAFQKEVEDVSLAVESGSALATAMDGKKYFTRLIIESVYVGEQAGSLDELLNTTAKFYDEDVENMLDQLATLIEPMLLVGLFVMVGFLAFAMFMPIWNMAKVVLPT